MFDQVIYNNNFTACVNKSIHWSKSLIAVTLAMYHICVNLAIILIWPFGDSHKDH